jgi:hypothetical protein
MDRYIDRYIIYRDHGKVLNECVIIKEGPAGSDNDLRVSCERAPSERTRLDVNGWWMDGWTRKIHQRQQTSNPGGYSCNSRPTELIVYHCDIESKREREIGKWTVPLTVRLCCIFTLDF